MPLSNRTMSHLKTMAEKLTCFVVEALVISCLGAVLCSGLPSSTVPLKSVNRGSIEDSFSSWPEHVRLEAKKSREMAYDGIRPPKHIMKVMKHLSQDDNLLRGRGNTVRSYSPHLGKYFISQTPSIQF